MICKINYPFTAILSTNNQPMCAQCSCSLIENSTVIIRNLPVFFHESVAKSFVHYQSIDDGNIHIVALSITIEPTYLYSMPGHQYDITVVKPV